MVDNVWHKLRRFFITYFTVVIAIAINLLMFNLSGYEVGNYLNVFKTDILAHIFTFIIASCYYYFVVRKTDNVIKAELKLLGYSSLCFGIYIMILKLAN
jgi:membrane associated rhomboid family serine protease